MGIDNQDQPGSEHVVNSVKCFETSQGSLYTYDVEGKTTRFKRKTKETCEKQDITVFAQLTPDEEQFVLHAYRHVDPRYKDYKVRIYEKDESGKLLRNIERREDTSDQSRLCLAVVDKKSNTLVWMKDASLHPIEGANVFDMRHFNRDGQRLCERHLGNKVVRIYR